MNYINQIKAIAGADANTRHILAWMLLDNPTLDGLSASEFSAAVAAAINNIDASTDADNEAIAQSFGL